ncbi:condensation domain-containing protein, partial [Streptomyces malaysiensis]|uniref:condensation domain-containing protein n=1 Tax=Streptomyces malaysiensis TaxID=92644 RepID=UPI0036BFCAA9
MTGYQIASLPLTAAQSGIWLAQRLQPANPLFNIAEYIDIHGEIDPALFENALRRTVAEADTLRIRLLEEDGRAAQRVEEHIDWTLPFIDVSHEDDPRAVAESHMRAEMRRPVDPTTGPLFAFALFKAADDRYLWYQRYHHIVMDGLGLSLIGRRVAELYTALAAGLPCPEAPFGSLAELLDDEAAYRDSDRFTRDRAYWTARFAERPAATSLADRTPALPERLERRTAFLDEPTLAGLRATAREAEVSWPAVLVAAFGVYLHRMTGNRQVVLGLPAMARSTGRARTIPGMMSNVLPFRLDLHPGTTVAQAVRLASKELHSALKHQRYRAEDLRRDLELSGDEHRLVGPHINIVMVDYDLTFGGHRGTVHNLGGGPVDDLSLVVDGRAATERGRPGSGESASGGLRIDLDGNPELYGPERLADHQRRLLDLLGHFAHAAPDTPIGRIDLLAPEERERVLGEWNATARKVPDSSLPELFQAQAARTPQAPAVVFEGRTLTYAELNGRANRLAHLLIGHGAGPESLVALSVPRSDEMIVALLAILKAGAAYLPVDPGYPAERIAYMLGDAEPALVLTATGDTAGGDGPTSLRLDAPETAERLAGQP